MLVRWYSWTIIEFRRELEQEGKNGSCPRVTSRLIDRDIICENSSDITAKHASARPIICNGFGEGNHNYPNCDQNYRVVLIL